LRDVSRRESLEIILAHNSRSFAEEEILKMLEEKNGRYVELLENLTPSDILPGVNELLGSLESAGWLKAIGSSSKNATAILKKLGLFDRFDTVVDGNHISNSKPDPEVFLLGAEKLSQNPDTCIVFEDAQAGIEAALAAGMTAVGVGDLKLDNCTVQYRTLEGVTVSDLLRLNLKGAIN
ncbi:MAG: HAD-IA family hydrolase, partial [Spirochaetales bacterium]|nr:HAD-IA family hydrolase [Spirochaetales bacterium]